MGLDATKIATAMFLIYSLKATVSTPVAEDRPYKVLIIGSGVSGLGAGVTFLENGLDDFLILEANHRIGGRIYTVHIDDTWIDYGAECIDGKENNSVYEMVKDLDVVMDDERFFDMFESGNKRLNRELALKLFKIFFDFMEKEDDPLVTIDKAFEQSYNTEIEAKFSTNPEKLKLARKAYKVFIKCLHSWESTLDLSDATVKSNYVINDGEDSVWKKKGYQLFLDILIKEYPDPKKTLPIKDKILLEKEVTKIIKEGEKMEIECSDGTKYKSEYVIFTPSLGVLKAQHKTLFVPELPEDKQRVIESLGFGAVAKIFLIFPEPWWTQDVKNGFVFMWGDKDIEDAKKEFPEGMIKGTNDNWLDCILGFFKTPTVNKDTRILTGWVSGKHVAHIENLSDEELVNGSLYLLKRYTKSKGDTTEIPRPTVLRSKWLTDKRFKGTYSYDSIKSFERNITNDDLGTPVGNLRFAGEGTNRHHFGTVHGALDSGRREANRILKEIKH